MTSIEPPHAGPGWTELAERPALEAVLDPGDSKGAKNTIIDAVHKAALRRALAPLRGKRVLDYGCGNGRIAAWAIEQGANVVGIDATPAMVEAAQRRVPTGDFRVSSPNALPVEDGRFDLAVSVYVLQYYVSKPEKYAACLRSIRRALAPGGALVLVEQVANGEIGRGAPAQTYVDGLVAAGFSLEVAKPIRSGFSRVIQGATARPVLMHLPGLPAAVRAEARLTARFGGGGDYHDHLFVGRLPEGRGPAGH
jgi:SAM-dependent methyltransferase